jgi:hypothetical protein
MLARIDHWIGKEIFHPPIIWLCQLTGMSQRAVARYGWMLAAWTLVMRIGFQGIGDWLFSVIAILVTVLETARAAVAPDAPTFRNDWLRRIILIVTALDIVGLAFGTARHGFRGFNWNHAWDLFALIAEYAKTIETIPPREIKRRAGVSREAVR